MVLRLGPRPPPRGPLQESPLKLTGDARARQAARAAQELVWFVGNNTSANSRAGAMRSVRKRPRRALSAVLAQRSRPSALSSSGWPAREAVASSRAASAPPGGGLDAGGRGAHVHVVLRGRRLRARRGLCPRARLAEESFGLQLKATRCTSVGPVGPSLPKTKRARCDQGRGSRVSSSGGGAAPRSEGRPPHEADARLILGRVGDVEADAFELRARSVEELAGAKLFFDLGKLEFDLEASG